MTQFRHQFQTTDHRNRQNRSPFVLIFIFAVVLTCFTVWFPSQVVYAQAAPASVPSLQLHHVTLSVGDVEQISQWYADVLGFTIRDRFTLTRADSGQIQA
jgi:hypothetical protein